MTYYAIISTREAPSKSNKTLCNLIDYFTLGHIFPYIMPGEKSIYEAYTKALKEINPSPEDIIILCHDDIEIISNQDNLKDILKRELFYSSDLDYPGVAFVGVAGTTFLDKDAVWWEINRRKQGHHRGFVFQGKDSNSMTPNFFGLFNENVVVLDGCFLATTGYILNRIRTEKPKEFTGDWDFYDLYYTLQAFELGFSNKVVPIVIRHESNGELAGRKSWHENRAAFMKMFRLPVKCR